MRDVLGEEINRMRRGQRFVARLLAICAFALCSRQTGVTQTAMVSVVPDADSFLRSFAPTNNYGAGGALSVSGPAAVNGSGDQNGLFDSLIRFSMSNVVASLDNALGEHDWVVTQARLVLTEIAVPDNAIFNRGVGAFEVRWIASDGWTEGTGKPVTPTTDGVAWQDLPLILNSNLDQSLGVFTNTGANGPISFNLALGQRFLADLRLGGEVGLYLTAQSPQIGFTFDSRNFGNTNSQPMLLLAAIANPHPRIDSLAFAGVNVSVGFAMVSNWNYTLQFANDLSPAVGNGWSNLITVPARATNRYAVFVDGMTNQRRFYRLLLSP
jgi:hypothetical protein